MLLVWMRAKGNNVEMGGHPVADIILQESPVLALATLVAGKKVEHGSAEVQLADRKHCACEVGLPFPGGRPSQTASRQARRGHHVARRRNPRIRASTI